MGRAGFIPPIQSCADFTVAAQLALCIALGEPAAEIAKMFTLNENNLRTSQEMLH
jgi:hypothetical protein